MMWVPYEPTEATAALWERSRHIAPLARHSVASNYCDMQMDRAWWHELRRGAPSGGVVYPLGWWASGSSVQPNHENGHLSTHQWLLLANEMIWRERVTNSAA